MRVRGFFENTNPGVAVGVAVCLTKSGDCYPFLVVNRSNANRMCNRPYRVFIKTVINVKMKKLNVFKQLLTLICGQVRNPGL
ncbi:MAG: hypothetical protein K0R08_1841 [Solimicrobium sp.]|jgi:hypothetical protein|nr:hypothetical protein [Solimicrobium sp.]